MHGEALTAVDRISARRADERSSRAAAIDIALSATEALLGGSDGADFLKRRASEEAAGLTNLSERAMVLRLLDEEEAPAVTDLLVDYAARLEEWRSLDEADAVLGMARRLNPSCAGLALRAARIARMLGDRERAGALYADARDLDTAAGSLSRLAAIGEALLETDPYPVLFQVIGRALREKDQESAAVGFEERARLKRAAGDRAGALVDLARAIRRYTDAVDRGRAAFSMAEMCGAAGDLWGAREALLMALALGERTQQEFARARLYAISRDLRDQLGVRRWRSATPPRLVSLSPRPASVHSAGFAPMIARWRSRLEHAVAAGRVIA